MQWFLNLKITALKNFILVFVLLISLPSFCQVGINTSTPSNAAVLDINSEMGINRYGGLLIPKVTPAERLLIAPTSIDDGMMVYTIEGTTRCLQIYDATNGIWQNMYCMESNARPVATNVDFTGLLAHNQMLTAMYSYTDAENDLEDFSNIGTQYNWYSADNSTGLNQTLLQSNSLSTYTLTATDVDKWISVEVFPRATNGILNGFPVQSSYQGPITLNVIVDPWINELHYDNNGVDLDEGIEVAGLAGTDLSGWSLMAYNGSNGTTYDTEALSGIIPNEGMTGYGTMNFPFASLQNGTSDGMALVDPNDNVILFLSYEGVITGTDGPANGITSTDIGVDEDNTTLVGTSLQLSSPIGTIGSQYSDFNWVGSSAHSRGSLNTGQQFN